MKKILAILLFLIAFKAQSQTPQAPIVFTDTTQMSDYAGSYALGVVADTITGGVFSKQLSSATIDNVQVFRAYNTSYRWFKIANYDVGIQDSGYVKYSDSLTVFATPTQIHDSINGVVKYSDSLTVFSTPTQTLQTISDSTYWRLSGSSLYAKSTSYDVGIGTIAPLYRFHVKNGGEMWFNGTRMNIATQTANNKLIGLNAGISISGSNNIAFGDFANEFGGSNNISIGNSALDDIGGSNSVAVGNNTGWHNPGDNNTSIGHAANTNSYGGQNIALGTNTSTAKSIVTSTLNTSVIVTSSATISGATVATFITATGYSVGDTAVFNMVWNGGIPAPYISPSLNKKGKITSSNTIAFINATSFTSQGSGTFDIVAFNKQNNAIAIGYSTNTDSTNQIVIGNTNNTLLKANKFVVNLDATPTNGQALVWTTDRYVPTSIGAAAVTGTGLVFTTVAAMAATVANEGAYANVLGFYAVNDGGGGAYRYDSTSVITAVPGMVVATAPIGRWIAQIQWPLNIKRFGYVGDSSTYNNVLQSAVNWMTANYYGNTLYFPKGNYRDTSHTHWRSGVNAVLDEKANIFNDLPTLTRFNCRAPIFWGNLTPTAYDTSELKYFVASYANGSKVVIVDSISRFAVGNILIMRGNTFWINTDGNVKPFVARENRVTAIIGDTLILEQPLDTVVTKVAISGHYISGSSKRIDAYGELSEFIADVNIEGGTFTSNYGQMALGQAAFNCHFKNVRTYGQESFGGNGWSFCTFSYIYPSFYKQVWENAIGTHNTTISHVYATRLNMTPDEANKPLIKFGESVYDVNFDHIYINAAGFTGKGFWFGASTYCGVSDFEIHGQDISDNFIEFSNSADVVNNYIRNGTTWGSVSTHYVEMEKNAGVSATLSGNTIDNLKCYGNTGASGVIMDGTNATISNSYFEDGNISFGDSLVNAVVQNTYLNNPTIYNANANFKNVYNATATVLGSKGIALTEGTNNRIGQTTLVTGTKAITISGLTTGSRAIVTMVTPSGTTLTTSYQGVCTANTLTIQANVAAGTINTADGSTLNYLVIN